MSFLQTVQNPKCIIINHVILLKKCVCITVYSRVANSHAYGVILTHLACYSRTHAIDKFTHA